MKSQTDGRYHDAKKNANGETSACQNQVIGNNINDKTRKEVDNVVKTVENRMHCAILTAMDNVVIPPIEMAVRSIIESSAYGHNSAVQNPDENNFIGNTKNTPLKSDSRRLDPNIDKNRNDETSDLKNLEESNFPAFRPKYDRTARAHHMLAGHSAPQNSIPAFFAGCPTQNKPLPLQFTQPQSKATHISRNNSLPMVEQTRQRQNSNSGNHINTLAEAIADIASQQPPQTLSALFKPTKKNTLIFDNKNGQVKLCENFFQIVLKI